MTRDQMEALHNVRRTLESGRDHAAKAESQYVDVFNHCLTELEYAGIKAPEVTKHG